MIELAVVREFPAIGFNDFKVRKGLKVVWRKDKGDTVKVDIDEG